MTYKSCGNCKWGDTKCDLYLEIDGECMFWHQIPCPRCGGILSETREHKGVKYRHCYSCHAEFPIEGD